MQVILLDKISNLGRFGDKVDVKAGYARNFLIPKGKAVLANKKNIEYFKAYCADLETKLANIQIEAKARVEKINELGSITISSKAGDKGKLFGSVGTRDIAHAISIAGVNVARNEVRLPNGILRTIGTHSVRIQVHGNLFATLNVIIVPKI